MAALRTILPLKAFSQLRLPQQKKDVYKRQVLEQSLAVSPAKQGAPAARKQVDAALLKAFGKQLFTALRTTGLLKTALSRQN